MFPSAAVTGISILVAIATVGLSVVVYPYVKAYKIRREVLKIPGPPIKNIFRGILADMPKERHEDFDFELELASHHWSTGFYSKLLGPIPAVAVVGPEAVKEILGSPKEIVKTQMTKLFEPFIGEGLLLAKGSKWKEMRHLLTPAFHFQILNRYLHSMNEQSDILIERISKQAKNGKFDIFQLLTDCALDIIAETAMGVPIHAQQSEKRLQYVDDVNKATWTLKFRMMNPLMMNDFFYSFTKEAKEEKEALKRLHHFSYKVIAERRKWIQENSISTEGKLSFLDLLLTTEKDGKSLTDEEIRAEVDTFMFAGHETTSHSLSWTLNLLGLHPEIQKRVQDEVDEVMGDATEVSPEMLGQFKYMDMVVKESLRLFPAAPMIGRSLVEDLTLQGYTIPKGTFISFLIFAVHRNPLYWDEPEKFDPDRWLPENSAGRNPYAFVPFAAGPRNCIGQKFAGNEQKALLAKIMKNFTIKALEPNPRKVMQVVLKPIDGIWVTATPRTN